MDKEDFNSLEEKKYYVISFDDKYTKTDDIKMFEIKVLLKLN